MLASGSSLLSEISRNLNESIPIIKTVNHLSGNLADFSGDERSVVPENYLKAIKSRYGSQSVIVIDGSDIEEYFKFKKQCFDYENLRVRSLRSIRNLDFLLMMAIGYISKLSDKDDTMILRLDVISVSKRMFDVSNFMYYSIADGIFEILKYTKRGMAEHLRPLKNDGQLCFVGWVA